MDGDWKPDIITGAWWYKNPGTAGGIWTRQAFGSPLNNMAAVFDFDNNGTLDVLGTEGVGADANSQFVWARNDGAGRFTILNNIQQADGTFLRELPLRVFTPAPHWRSPFPGMTRHWERKCLRSPQTLHRRPGPGEAFRLFPRTSNSQQGTSTGMVIRTC